MFQSDRILCENHYILFQGEIPNDVDPVTFEEESREMSARGWTTLTLVTRVLTLRLLIVRGITGITRGSCAIVWNGQNQNDVSGQSIG